MVNVDTPRKWDGLIEHFSKVVYIYIVHMRCAQWAFVTMQSPHHVVPF